MSSNSGCSRAQTAPIVCSRCCSGRRSAAAVVMLIGPNHSSTEKGQAVFADLKLVVVLELGGLDPLPVHEGAVEAAQVADREGLAVADQLRMLARHGDVVEKHVAFGR